MTKVAKGCRGFSNNVFSFSLYRQGLKKLLLIGIIGIAVFVIPSFLSLLSTVAVRVLLFVLGSADSDNLILSALLFEYLAAPLSNTAMPILVATISVLVVFSFLNKRRDCDFYHGLPFSRLCLFNSFYFAAITWVLIICVPCAFFDALSKLVLFSTSLDLPYIYYLSVIPDTFGCILPALLAMSTVVFAKSISGTFFSNVIAFLSLTVSLVGSLALLAHHFFKVTPILFSSLGISLPDGYDIMLALYMMSGIETTSGSMLIYAILIIPVLIYSTLAAVAFCTRPSEIAGRPTLNRTVVHLLCGLLVLPLLILVISNVAVHNNIGYALSLAIPAIIFLASELILSRSFVRMLKSIPFFLLSAVVALTSVLGVGFVGNGAEQRTLNSIPKASEIEKITVKYSPEGFRYVLDCSFTNYEDIEFISAKILNYYENIDSYDSFSAQSAVITLKNGDEKTYAFDMSEEDEKYLDILCDTNMCTSLLRTALYGDPMGQIYDSENYPITGCTIKIAYLDDNGMVCNFTADESLSRTMLAELESKCASEHTSLIDSGGKFVYERAEHLWGNKYGVYLEFTIDPISSDFDASHATFTYRVDTQSYPLIHNAITEYLDQNEIPRYDYK